MKTIMKSRLGRNSIRIISVIISMVLVVQLIGLGDIAYGASTDYFRGYNEENVVPGFGNTFMTSGMTWEGSTLKGTAPTGEGLAIGYIALDEAGHSISNSVDLGSLEIDFSAASVIGNEASRDVPYITIDFSPNSVDGDLDERISRIQLNKQSEDLSETLSSRASIPAGTRTIIVRLVSANTDGDNTVQFSNISLKINDTEAPSCSVEYNNGWTNALPLLVTVSASDGDSGLEGIYIGGTRYETSPKELKLNANTSFEVYARDYAGHESQHQTVSITNIDTLTPAAPNGVSLSHEGWTNSDVSVNLPALGTSTGAPEYYAYKLHSGDAWQEVPAQGLTVKDSGQYDLSVAVADRAGNRSSAYANTISIDKQNPVISKISGIVTSGSCAVTADINDVGLSGIAETKYALGSHDAAYFAENGTAFTGGTFTVSAGGTYTVYAIDKAGNTVVSECTINTAPSLVDIVSFKMDEDTTETVALNVNDKETPIGELAVTAVSSNTTLIPQVTINQDSTGISLSIKPAQDLSSPDPVTITVKVTDKSGDAVEDTFDVTVDPVNDAPEAADDAGFTVEEDGSVRIDVLTNDTDVDMDTLSIANPGTPAHGTTSVVANTIKYAPAANYNGDDSFTYTVTDGHGGTATATVSVTVTPVNDDPVAVADVASTNEDTDVVVNVLANDTDPDTGDSKTLVSATSGTKGTTTPDINSGTVTYKPNKDAYGQDTFQYTMQDGIGRTSTGTVSVTIRPVIDPPWFTGVSNEYTIDEDYESEAHEKAFKISFEIHDVDNETPTNSLMLQAVSSNETLLASKDIVISGLGDDNPAVQLSLTPKPNQNGQTNITLSLGDGFNTVTKVVKLNVTSINDLPVANQDTVYFDEGKTELEIDIADLLDNDTDIENGKPTFVRVASQPAENHGTVAVKNADTLLYTPGTIVGNTSFTYEVWDGTDSAIGTCRILVSALNKAPMLEFTSLTAATTIEDTQSGEILFTISDDQTPIADLVKSTWSGDLTKVKPTGINLIKKDDNGHYALQITPEANANGIVLIYASVSDGMEYVEKSFTFTINKVNDKPVAVDDTVYVPVSGSQTFDAVANDIDVDGDDLFTSLDILNGDYAGTLTYNESNRCFTYAAANGESGTKHFDYVVSDGVLTDTGTVTMHIEDAKYPPEISAIANQYINEDTPSHAIEFTVTDRDTENAVAVTAASNNDTLLPKEPDEVSGTEYIKLTKTGDHTYSLVLTPAADEYGTATVTITADDGTGFRVTRSFTLTVMSVNDAPTAVDDTYTVDEDTTISNLNLLANDSDIEHDTIWVSAISTPAFGQITKTGDTYTYRPYRNMNGTETLTYTVTDGKDTATAKLTINVTAVNDAPVAWTDYLTLPNNTASESGLIDVLSNDSDVEKDTLTILSFTQGTYGTVIYDEAAKKLRYTRTGPGSGDNGEDSFTYTIIDRSSTSVDGYKQATGTVRIGIHFTSSIYCYDIYKETTEDGASVPISLPISNPNNVPIKVTIAPTTLGNFSGSGKDWIFTPSPNMHDEEVAIRYTVTEQTSSDPETAVDGDSNTDGRTETASANIIMSVHSVNDAPVIETVHNAAVTNGVNTSEVFDEDSEGVSFDVTFGDVDTEDVLKFYTYTYDANTLAPVALDLDVRYTQETGVAHVTAKPLYANSNGTIALLLGVSDGIAQDTHVIDVTVSALDDAPVLEAMTRTLYEDTSAAVTVITPNTDVDGGTDMAVSITKPDHGSAVLDSGVITYTPAPNWFGTDKVNYTVTDQTPGALSSTETVTFKVLPVNDPLSFSKLNYYNTTNEDSLIKVPCTVTNVDDLMSDTSLYTITSSNTGVVRNDAISIACVGQDDKTGDYSMEISLNPVGNASGVTYIHIKAVDGRTGDDMQTAETEFRLEVVPVNDAPTADDRSVDVTEYSGVTGTPGTTSVLIDLSGSIHDVEDGIPAITSVTVPGKGKIQNNHNSTLTYTVQGDYNGTDTFVYTVMDKNGATDTGKVTVNVFPANDAPLAKNDTAVTNEDTMVTIPVLTNDSDIDGDELVISNTTVSTVGAKAQIVDQKSIDYTPALNFFGTDTFIYEVSDGHGGTGTATVTIEVSPENDPPEIRKYPDPSAIWEMDEDKSKAFDFEVSDPETTDISKLIITITSTTTNMLKTEGILLSSESEHKVLTVTPEDNVNGDMWVHFDVTDGDKTTQADYKIIVHAINDAPVMDPESVTTNEDTEVSGTVTAKDIDSETISFSKASDPAHGSVTVSSNGGFTYIPTANYSGTDSFNVTVSDGQTVNGSSTGTVTVTVLPVNDPPKAVNDERTIAEDGEVDVDVLTNDIEYDLKDGDKLTITSFSGVSHGTLSRVTAEGQPDKIKYKPDANWNGTDSFTYTIKDSEEKVSTAAVTITVTPVNDAPSGGDDTASTNEDNAVDIAVTANDDIDETTNAADEDVTVVPGSVSTPSNGTAVLKDSKTITYTPAANYFGSDLFTYTAKDAKNETAVFTVNVTVNPVNDAPTITDIADKTILEDGTTGELTVSVGDVDKADSDLIVTVTRGNTALLPPVTVNNAGEPGTEVGERTFTLTPYANKNGSSLMTITVTDGELTATDTFTLTVTAQNDYPTAVNDAKTTDENTPVLIDVLANDDIDLQNEGDASLYIASVSSLSAGRGTAEIVTDGGRNKIKFTPDTTMPETSAMTVTFTYTAQDSSGAAHASAATVNVTVTPVNDAPTISNVADVTILEDQPGGTGTIGFEVRDEEDDDDTLAVAYTCSNAALFETITLTNPTGDNGWEREFVTIPKKDASGTALFTLTVTDAGGKTASDQFNVNVTAVDDDPYEDGDEGNDAVTVTEDVLSTLDVLTNDDPDYGTEMDNLKILGIVDEPEHGTVNIINDGRNITYKTEPNGNASDSFSYQMQSGTEGNIVTHTYRVTITVTPVNDAPVIELTKVTKYDGADPLYEVDEGRSYYDTYGENIPFTISDVDGDTLGVTAKGSNQMLVLSSGLQLSGTDGNREINVTPNGKWNGSTYITLTVTDGHLSTSKRFKFNVASFNEPPTAFADTAEINEDELTKIDVLVNDKDPDLLTNSDELFVDSVLCADSNLTVAVSSDHKGVDVTPKSNYNGGPIEFDYTMRDRENVKSSAKITVTVKQVNDAPVAANDAGITTNEEQSVIIDALANDTDVDMLEFLNANHSAEKLSITTVAKPANGTASVQTVDGYDKVVYTPKTDFNGSETFSYTIKDVAGVTKTAQITVSVSQVNDNPVAVTDNVSTNEDTPKVIDPLANDTDVDTDAALNAVPNFKTTFTVTAANVAHPEYGSVTISGDSKTITYTPVANNHDNNQITYTVSDGHGGSGTGTVNVTVISVNDAPVISVPANMSLTEDGENGTSAFTVSDVETPAGSLTMQVISTSNGSLAGITDVTFSGSDGSRNVIVNPQNNQNDTVGTTVRIRVTDADGGTADATFVVTVAPVNDAPTANGADKTIPEDTVNYAIDWTQLTSDVDIATNADVLSISEVTVPTHGSATFSGNNLYYTPTANYNGDDSFTYTVKDKGNETATATITMHITQVNDAPVVTGENVTIEEDTWTTIDVLSNDTDIDTDTTLNHPANEVLTIASIDNHEGAKGTATLVYDEGLGRDVIKFDPDANFNGSVSFDYYVSDGKAAPVKGSVTMMMTQVNDAPEPEDDIASVSEGEFVDIDVLLNDYDVDTDGTLNADLHSTASFRISQDAGDVVFVDEQHGSVSIVDNKLHYAAPSDNWHGAVKIRYTLKDGHGLTGTATVTVTVNAVNDRPVFETAPKDLMITEDGSDSFSFTVYDEETAAENLNVEVASTGDAEIVDTSDVSITKGTGGDRTVTVTPNANQHGGPIKIRLTVEDGDHEKNVLPYEFFVTVTPVKDDPVAKDTAVTTAEETAAVIDVSSLISDNDLLTDPGEALTVSVEDVNKPSVGSVSVAEKQITYTPALDWNGVVSFKYTVKDASGASDEGLITVTVTQVNDAPVAKDDKDIAFVEDTPKAIDVLANDSDVDMDGALNAAPGDEELAVSVSEEGLMTPKHGTVSEVDNKIVYTPADNFNGTDEFEYYVSDGVLQDKGYVSVSVAQVNDNPVAKPDTVYASEDTKVSCDVLENDEDADTVEDNNLAELHFRDSFAVQSYAFVGAGYGTLSQLNGVISYEPNPGFSGRVYVDYVLIDGHGGTATARLTIIVNGVNDAPKAVEDKVTTAEDALVDFNVLDNDTDQDIDDVLSFVGLLGDTSALHGTIITESNGDVTYTPETNYNGTESIQYIVMDFAEATDTGTITITVTPVNDAPTAGDKTVSTNEGMFIDISVEPLIDDVDEDSLTVTVETAGNPAHGTAKVTGKDITYTPNPDWNGTDSFTYTVTDPSGETDTGVITVAVAQVNNVPVADDDNAATNEDQPVWISVLENDTDKDTKAELNAHPEDEVLVLSVGDAGLLEPAHGTAVLDGNQVKYTPDANYNGTDRFEYRLSDGDAEDLALVTVTIQQVNDAPVANDDTAVTNDEDMVIISVLDNDTDVDTQSGLNSGQIYTTQDFKVTSVSAPANGKAIISGNKVAYTPADKFAGTDSFTYVMTDGHGGTASATVKVTVKSVNDPPAVPVVTSPVQGSRYGGESTVNVTWTGYDIDGDPLTYTLEYYDGASWLLIKTGLSATSYDFKLPETLTSITNLQFRVSASDAEYTSGFGYSGKLAVDKSVPANIVVKMTKADGKPYIAGTWTNQSVTVTAVSVEDASAVTFKYAMEDKTFAAEPGKTVVSGVHNVFIQAADEFGNVSEFGGYLIKIDKQPPAVPKTGVTVSGNEAQLKFTLSADPGGSGNSHIVMPDGTVKTASSDLTWSVGKNDTYALTIVDNVGNSTKFNVTVNSLDETPPTIECSTGSYVIGDTTLENITAVLTYADDKAEIVTKGYAVTETKTYAGVYQSYAGDIVLSKPGTYYIHAFAKNSFGLTATKTFGPFKIVTKETGTPASPGQEPEPGNGPTEPAQPVMGDVTLSAPDVVQDAVKIRLPDGQWQDSLVLDDIEPGTYLIEVMDENGNVRIVEVTITDEDIAFGQFQPKTEAAWYVYAGSGGAAGLLLLLLLLLWRNVKIEAFVNRDSGRTRTVKVIRKLRRSRDILVIDLRRAHIKDSMNGVITLSEGLTRRMRSKTLSVTLEGREVFNAVLPDDTRGSFQGTIENWNE